MICEENGNYIVYDIIIRKNLCKSVDKRIRAIRGQTSVLIRVICGQKNRDTKY